MEQGQEMTEIPSNSDNKDIHSSCEFIELNTASESIYLRGVYVTNDVKYFKRCKARVVKSKSHVLFPLKNVSERDESVHFTNEEGANQFFHDLSNFGYSAALQIHKCNEEKNQPSDLHRRFFFRVVGVKEWTPQIDDLCLSSLAIRFLQDIEKKLLGSDLDKKAAEDDCISFFEMFGTHVYLASVTVGGVFAISADTAVQKHDDIKSTQCLDQQVQSKASVDNVFKDTKVESTGMEDNGKEKCKLQKENEIGRRKLGGPQNINDFTEWKSELIKNPETWTISDMGELSFENCIGIWSLMKKHSRHFSNVEELSYFLAEIWMCHIAHGMESGYRLSCLWSSFVESLISKLSTPPSITLYLESLKEMLHFLEHHVVVVGKPMVIKTVDVFSETSVHTLFKESANYKTPVHICFQILTTKLSILQTVKGNHATFGISSIASDYSIPGMLLQRELTNVEELLDLLESELLPGIGVLQAQNGVDFKKVQLLAKSEIQSTVQNFLQRLIDRKEYQEALLLLVISMSIGYHLKREEILTDITFEVLETFISSAKGEISLTKKYKSQENQEAWLLLRMIFKLDTSYRIYNESTELANEFNNFVCFLKERGFILHSNTRSVIDSKHGKDCLHEVIHSFAKTSIFPCELFDRKPMRIINLQNTESRADSDESDALHHMINAFGMGEFFPQKLSTEDVLKLSDAFVTSPKTLKDIPWVIFRQMIAINYNFRESVLSDFLNKSKVNSAQTLKRRKGTKQSVKKNTSTKYNPMDVFLVLWHCCDPFLKKILASKITTCQLALPFIYEDIGSRQQLTLSLWPIRDIFIDDSPNSVLTKSLKTVSFVRIGDLKSVSKSKIINKFLRGQNNEHNTFYHRDCTLASNQRLVSNGLIEITWYVPRKNNDDNGNSSETGKMLEEICILNMRGDAKNFRSHLTALLALSDVVVVMSEFEILKNEQSLKVLKEVHSSSSVPIIMADFPGRVDDDEEEEGSNGEEDDGVEDEEEEGAEDGGEKEKGYEDEKNDMSLDDSVEMLHHLYQEQTGLIHPDTLFLSTLDRDDGKTLNEWDLRNCLLTQITSALRRINLPKSLEKKKMLLPTFVSVDEDDANSRYGSNLSEAVIADVEFSENQIKDKVLPLQGEKLWHTWCLKQKQSFRSGKQSVFENVPHENMMKTLRLWQVMYGLESQNTMVKFVNALASHIDDRQTIMYFLQYMKYHMDCQSREVIPNLSKDFYKACKEFETLLSQSDRDEKKVETKELQIKSAEKNLANASFGLEHFFREMGQLYESLVYCNQVMFIHLSSNSKCVIEKLPYIAAKLISWGHPLEIMDGDAASVPACWIKATFKEIRSIIGENKTLYVISVLGIQSSGKSTLLNTMFGLQFSVSAGRCTRGIYAQLIPVDKTKSSLKFDYALVIDTEGLRAPELGGEKFHHDNELATLVIGLADVALINIKGETIADMQDVLQIVVHALIRLKNANEELNIKQSCVFVHQNVSASNAGRDTFQGSQKVTSDLDKMTKHIAEQEKMANITRFTDVIAFNPVENVIHVPDLWQGIPPMAPASPEYSKKVVQVAKCILGDICENKTAFLNCQNTSLHLENLWKGILSEDFVFSFKNALEVKAFTLLEVKFQNIIWSLEELKLQYLQNKLGQIVCCETSEKLQSTITDIKHKFNESLQENTCRCNKELQDFFDKSDLKNIMAHWRARKTEELNAISKKIEIEIETKINSERGKCEALFHSKQKLSSIKREVTGKAIEFAKSAIKNENKMNKKDVEKEFQLLWKTWLSELAPEVSQDTIQNKIKEMKMQIQSEVRKKFSDCMPLYKNTSNWRPSSAEAMPRLKDSIKIEDIDEKDIDVIGIVEKIISKFGKYFPEKIVEFLSSKKYYQKAKVVLDRIFSEIETYWKTLNENVEYNSAQFILMLNCITEGFQNHNDKVNTHEFKVTRRLEIKTVLMVQMYAVEKFEQHIKKYETNNSLRSKMSRCKSEVESLFVGMYFETEGEEMATIIISQPLIDALNKKLLNDLYTLIWTKVTRNFANRKEPLIKAVLTDLAQKHEFHDYIRYIEDPKSFVKSWIIKYTSTIFDREIKQNVSELEQNIMIFLESACDIVIKCARDAGAESEEKVTPWEHWIDCFIENLNKEDFPVSSDAFQNLFEVRVTKFENFFKNIERQLLICRKSILESRKGVHLSNMNWEGDNPCEEIMKCLWKCNKCCPWCFEPCNVSSPEDRHSCSQHRPGGIGGVRNVCTGQLVCESCDFSIQSDKSIRCGSWCKCDSVSFSDFHPYREYKKYIKDSWDISGSTDMSSSKYWTWVFREFEQDFVKHYNARSPDFPKSDAFKVTKEDAVMSLSVYN